MQQRRDWTTRWARRSQRSRPTLVPDVQANVRRLLLEPVAGLGLLPLDRVLLGLRLVSASTPRTDAWGRPLQ